GSGGNVYQPVQTDAFPLSYDEFWEGFRRLLAEARLMSTTGPVLNAMLGAPFSHGTGCGRRPVRVTPGADGVPCVYWTPSDLRLADLFRAGPPGALPSPPSSPVRHIPPVSP